MASDLQARLDSLRPGETLQLDPAKREHPGPLVVRAPVVIDGQGATLWAALGPVLVIEADGVTVQDLNVEVTGKEGTVEGEAACAVKVQPGLSVNLQGVSVRGTVLGLAGEEGDWSYPRGLTLGTLKPGKAHEFRARLVLPVPCRLVSQLPELEVTPAEAKPGLVEVSLKVAPLAPGARVRGEIWLQSARLVRRIQIIGTVAEAEPPIVPVAPVLAPSPPPEHPQESRLPPTPTPARVGAPAPAPPPPREPKPAPVPPAGSPAVEFVPPGPSASAAPRRRPHRPHPEEEGGVNLGLVITPMLDMSFQLLAFFVMIYHPSALEAHIDGRLLPPPPARTAELVDKKGADKGPAKEKDPKKKEEKDKPPADEPDRQLARLAVDESQEVALTGKPTAGGFTLSYKGQTTVEIPPNASAAVVQAALVALPNIGKVVAKTTEGDEVREVVKDNVRVTGPDGGPWRVRFANKLAGKDAREITASGAGLTGGDSPGVRMLPTTHLVLRRPVEEEADPTKTDLQEFASITVHTTRFREGAVKKVKSEITLERPGTAPGKDEPPGTMPKITLVERDDPLQESQALRTVLKLVRAELQRLRKEPGGERYSLVIDADPSLRYGLFIAIQDTSKAAGFENIGFGAPAGS
jgi:biopolymer transport protein ExbD